MTQAAGVAVALLGAGALAVAIGRGPAGRSGIEDGLVSAVLAYERVLALLGMGLGAARQTGLPRWSSVVAVAVGIAAGIVGEADVANSTFVANHLFLIALPGPAASIVAGLGLAAPLQAQKWILPCMAAVIGGLIGLAIGFAAPAGEMLGFSTGATLGCLWIAATPALLLPPLRITWTRILVQILGSWLIAIGVMLGAARLIPATRPPEPLPVPSPALPMPATPPHHGADELRQEP